MKEVNVVVKASKEIDKLYPAELFMNLSTQRLRKLE